MKCYAELIYAKQKNMKQSTTTEEENTLMKFSFILQVILTSQTSQIKKKT